MKIDSSKLIPSLIFPFVVGFSGSFFTMGNTQSFFNILNKPPLTPPGWLFGPAWTVLYLMIGLALYTFWNSKKPAKLKKTGYLFFLLQLLANFLWSLLFFGMRSPLAGMINISILLILIVINILLFWRVNKTSGYLLLPYLAWVAFASYLNMGVLLLN